MSGQYPPPQGGYPPAKMPPAKTGGKKRSPLVISGVIGAIALVAVIAFFVLRGGGGGALASIYGADKMPNTFSMYASIRTDDGYINSLNDIFVRFRDPIAQVMRDVTGSSQGIDSLTLPNLLDQLVQSSRIGTNFNSSIRSWLGNYAAIGGGISLTGFGADFIIAIAITNKAEATNFVRANFVVDPDDWSESQNGDFTIFTLSYPSSEPEANRQAIAINNDALYMVSRGALIPTSALSSPLSADNKFTATLSALPAGSYNITLYANIDTLLGMARLDWQILRAINLLGMNGTIAAGATILDGRSFTIDMALKPSTTGQTAFTAISTPIDLDFARFMPQNTLLMAQGANLKQTYDVGISLLRTSATGSQIVDQALQQISSATSIIGLNFQSDIIDWLTGDYAIYMAVDINRLISIASNPSSALSGDLGVELGLLIKVTDSGKASNIVERLAGVIGLAGSQIGLRIDREQIGGANAVIIDLSNLRLPLKFVIGANNDVLVVGTYNSARDALNGSGGLNGGGRYRDALGYMLGNSTILAYVDRDVLQFAVLLATWGPSINNVFNNIIGGSIRSSSIPSQTQIQQLQNTASRLINLFNSSTITTAVLADGTFLARANIILAP